MLGVPQKRQRKKHTDFRDQVGVYVLYQNFRPVYIGQTGSGNAKLFNRLRHHRKDHLAARWDAFSWFGFVPVNSKSCKLRRNYRVGVKPEDALNHLEAVLIAVLEPPLNLQRGRFERAQQYIQHNDSRLPPTLDERIEGLEKALNDLEGEL